jgi:hypothetical protein
VLRHSVLVMGISFISRYEKLFLYLLARIEPLTIRAPDAARNSRRQQLSRSSSNTFEGNLISSAFAPTTAGYPAVDHRRPAHFRVAARGPATAAVRAREHKHQLREEVCRCCGVHV